MANELPNAVSLMRSTEFRDWIMAASVYQARLVFLEPSSTADHDVRMKMARDVISSPNILVERLTAIIAADPDVCSIGDTPQAVGQPVILQKVSDVWTPVAKYLY
jgi:hypothetical protein